MLLTISTVSTRSLYLSRTAIATLAICLSVSAHAQASDADGGDQSAIIVTGARQAQRDAIAEKMAADNTVETLRANDVGKLPDQNVAEAVKRLPGLSVANDQGEGRYVIIRGIDPNLINVTLNGQTLPAPEPAGRVVKLDDLPSAMIQAITVTKSLLSSQDANAVGGEVNIRTKTAFDNARPFFLDARASSGVYGLNRKFPYEMDGTIGGRFGADEQFGAVVSVNYSNRPIESENFQGSEDYSHGGIPDGNGLRDYNLTRTRLGIVGNFDWHPSDAVKLYLRTSYSKFEDHETRDQNRLAITDYASDPLAGTATMLIRRREENDNTKSATLGGEFDVAGGKLEMSGGWTKAVKEDPLRSEFTFTSKKGSVAIDYDASTYPYTLVPTGSSAGLFTTPSLFTLSKYNLEQRYAYEQLWQGRADYEHPIAIGDDSAIKVGVKYLDRHKSNDQNKTDYKNGSTVFNASSVAYQGDSDFYDGLFGFGNRIDYWAARAYAAANPSVLKIDAAGTLSDSLSSDYDVTESITAGYAMATLKFGGLALIPGVRVEHTVDHSKAKIVDANSTLDDDYNSFGHTSYTDVFPGLNAKFAVNPSLFLRGAVTTSIGRPNYASLAPYVVVEDDTVPNISIGNTGLKPYKAVNYDASIEFYPNKDSLFSAGFFHKDIDNPIYDYSQRLTNVTYGNVDYATADVSQPVNADSETLTGVELNAQTQFTFLPGLLSGFGLSANYTHIWGHATASAIRSGNIPLFYQSSNVGNVQLFYEKYNLAVRLAFNYRSAYLDALGSDAGTDEYTDGNGQLDLHASYQVTPHFSLFTDISNLTDAPWRRYIGSKLDLIEREHYGAQYRLGVQLHF
ncbi:TonB-dependent receptor [Sphingobium sp. BYY-5]|uniref:TonB-dependent receptor n=1 Tax=Sphingobium sp. BYY-5 TaxID=2926400 RepID=UPI001FA76A5E|nr:TonB-dependent receptor [Sphingobium sp. BYY-5]MCI4588925.1 TonB-dependent receptor [Sphingobium sp. BYY-5]